MRKLVLAFALLFGLSLASCDNTGKKSVETTDTTVVDTIDSTVIDSAVVDSVK